MTTPVFTAHSITEMIWDQLRYGSRGSGVFDRLFYNDRLAWSLLKAYIDDGLIRCEPSGSKTVTNWLWTDAPDERTFMDEAYRIRREYLEAKHERRARYEDRDLLYCL